MRIRLLSFLLIFLFSSQSFAKNHTPKHTPISTQKILSELESAHYIVFGKTPSFNRLHVAAAQVFLETGKGKKLFGYNFGNIGPSSKEEFHIFSSIPKLRFRTYISARTGAIGYWRFMKLRFPIALQCFDAGDIECATRSMAGRYFKANQKVYCERMKKIYKEEIK